MVLKHRLLLVSVTIWVLAVPMVKGQQALNAADSQRIAHFLDTDKSPDLLRCSIQPLKPLLDFALRYDAGYIVTCSFTRFEGRESHILIFARVTPEGGKALLLGQYFLLPEERTNPRNLKQNFQMSGGFAVGEGKYQIEVMVGDRETHRQSKKSWSVRVAGSGNRQAGQFAVPPASVLPIDVRPWPIKMDTTGKGYRVTVLLDAAPLNPRSPSLRAWDRAFLLESLSSLLKEVPCASVRLRAFNLDQQHEIFRQDQFDEASFAKLEVSLQNLELGTVSARVLQQPQGWFEMLLNYAHEEVIAADPSDFVVFLGPRTRYLQGIPRARLPGRETPKPHFYYLEFFPNVRGPHYPDGMASLTKGLDGTVYELASPADLVRSVQKMLARVGAPEK